MNSWWVPALACFLLWGVSRFFPKLAVNHIDPNSALTAEIAGELLVVLVVLANVGFRTTFDLKGTSYALLAGIFGGLGVYAYLLGAQRGNVSQLVAVSALYPVVTVLLGLFLLGEAVTTKQIVGMVFAFLAILLVAT